MKRSATFYGIIVIGVIGIIFISSLIFSFSKLGHRGTALTLGDKIGVIELKGVIIDSKEIVDDIIRFKNNSSVKAVVIRIDSPGGGVGPSQEIYSEVKKLKEKKKVVVSMGGITASGGYYIACGADKIYANPGTMTGSIGVIMEFANIEELLKKIGLRLEVIKSGKHKDIGNPARTMTPEERELLQSVINNVYQQFVQAVASGRKLDVKKVQKIADGRIFSGEQAKKLGLVDEMGDFQDAVDGAAKLAGIKGEPSLLYPEKRRLSVFSLFSEDVFSILNRVLGELNPYKMSYVFKP